LRPVLSRSGVVRLRTVSLRPSRLNCTSLQRRNIGSEAPTEIGASAATGSIFDKVVSYQQILSGELAWYEYPLKTCQAGLELLQYSTGSTWFAVIIAASIAVRFMLFPLAIKQTRVGTQMAILAPEIKKHSEMAQARAQARATKGLPAEGGRMDAINKVYKKFGISPYTQMMYSLPQIPIFILLFLSFRNMCFDPVFIPNLAVGGYSWFTDLTQKDPTYIIPVIAGLSTIGVMETAPKLTGTKPGLVMKYLSRGSIIVMIFVASLQPMGVGAYWIGSSISTMLSNFVLINPTIRKMLNIPLLEKEYKQVPFTPKPNVVAPTSVGNKKKNN